MSSASPAKRPTRRMPSNSAGLWSLICPLLRPAGARCDSIKLIFLSYLLDVEILSAKLMVSRAKASRACLGQCENCLFSGCCSALFILLAK